MLEIKKISIKSVKILFSIAFLVGVSEITARRHDVILISYTKPEGRGYGFLSVTGDIKASRKKVWSVLTRTDEHICTHTKDVLKFSINKIGEGKYLAYYLLDYPWPMEDRWQKLIITHDKIHYRIYWERIEGTIKRNSGYYNLEDGDDFTTLNYRVEFDPGLNYVPDALVNYVVKIQAPKILKNIRKCVYASKDQTHEENI